MGEELKIAALPLDIVWADVERNIDMVDEKLTALPEGTDIVVLPEMFSTGFIQDEQLLASMADDAFRQSLDAVVRWSRKYDVAVAGSMLARENGLYFNRGFFAEPDGKVTSYDKRHLFCLSAESRVYSRGTRLPPVVQFRGWDVMLLVCYDLRFPVWCRREGATYDVLLVVANWAAARGYAFRQLLIARAIENQAVVVGCNRSGHDDYGDYDYQSYIFDPFGYELAPDAAVRNSKVTPLAEDTARCGEKHTGAPDDFITAVYTKAQLQKVRSYLPVGRDADDFKVIFEP